MLRVIREARPTYVVAENVRGLVNWSEGLVFDVVCTDLERRLPSRAVSSSSWEGVGAPHKYRIWFVAYTNHQRDSDGCGEIPGAQKAQRLQEWDHSAQPGNAEMQTKTGHASEDGKAFPRCRPFLWEEMMASQKLDGITFPNGGQPA